MTGDEPPTIDVTAEELNSRLAAVRAGVTTNELSATLGGPPFRQDGRGGAATAMWRFRLPGPRYEIYRAELVDGRLALGSLLPHGGA